MITLKLDIYAAPRATFSSKKCSIILLLKKASFV